MVTTDQLERELSGLAANIQHLGIDTQCEFQEQMYMCTPLYNENSSSVVTNPVVEKYDDDNDPKGVELQKLPKLFLFFIIRAIV